MLSGAGAPACSKTVSKWRKKTRLRASPSQFPWGAWTLFLSGMPGKRSTPASRSPPELSYVQAITTVFFSGATNDPAMATWVVTRIQPQLDPRIQEAPHMFNKKINRGQFCEL
ncbi:hypothetical protein [Labrenzia sp. 011]|uniref:hypothetical protein n=1 Tax=Labrenzia sp. 011 TaxID=2171494 RepID=UPI001403BAFA|nr:hypothetical protein [Labrenzia sp. 011]